MGVLLDAVELIQKKIEKENNRPWKEVIEEVKEELESNQIFIKNGLK
ncbi:hypothetical protein [Tepidibacter aestuarii]|nr:hypothetical protein [Tepidibacter aestuarii]CAH2213210.1 protein of unknown function [Tepidibacter aestuarii]